MTARTGFSAVVNPDSNPTLSLSVYMFLAPALLWVGKGPLCRFVRVEAVNPGSQACVGNPGDIVVTARIALLVLVLGIALIALVYQLLRLNRPRGSGGGSGGGTGGGISADAGTRGVLWIGITALLAVIGVGVASRVAGEGVVFEIRGFQSRHEVPDAVHGRN